MGNTYGNDHYASFKEQQTKQRQKRRKGQKNKSQIQGTLIAKGELTEEKLAFMRKIAANYGNKLNGYCKELYGRVRKSVLLWTVQDIETWLEVIGMKSHFHQFKKLGIDGSCVFLIEPKDIMDEIGIKSAISLAIFQAWFEVGFKEYEKYVEKEQQARRTGRNLGGCERIDHMIKSVNSVLMPSDTQKEPQNCHMFSSHKVHQSIMPVTLSKAQALEASNTLTLKEAQEIAYESTTKLEVLDVDSNICLEIDNFPMGMIGQFEAIYHEHGVTAISVHQSDSQLDQVSSSMSNNGPRLSLRKEMKNPITGIHRAPKQKSNNLFTLNKGQSILNSCEIKIAKMTNQNNIDEYRLSFMADLNPNSSRNRHLCRHHSRERPRQRERERETDVDNDTDEDLLGLYKQLCQSIYDSQQSEEEESRQWKANRQGEINAYVMLNEPMPISSLCSGLEECNSWKFVVGDFVFVPQFSQKKQSDPILNLFILDSTRMLTLDPNPSSISPHYKAFYVCLHENKKQPQICQPPADMAAQQWLHEMDLLKYAILAAIVYVRAEKLYYLAEVNWLPGFVRGKLREAQQKGKSLGDGTDRKVGKLKIEDDGDENSIGHKCIGKRKSQQRHSEQVRPTEQAQPKYSSNRKQYSRAPPCLSIRKGPKLWAKLPIHQFSNKLTPQNSIKIGKGTALRLGRREFIFNINTTIVKEIDRLDHRDEADRINEHVRNMVNGGNGGNWGVQGNYAGNKCIICFERPSNCIYLECRHSAACINCSKGLEKCPVCRKPISNYLRVYNE